MIFTKREYINFAIEHNWKIYILSREEHALGKGNTGGFVKEIKNFLDL
jgi:hypothetical protein